MSDWKQSRFKCPACGERLLHSIGIGSVYIWCGNGTCPSVVSNDGARSESEEAAYSALRANIENEDQ